MIKVTRGDIQDVAYQLEGWKDDFSATSGVVTAVYKNINGLEVEDTFDDDMLDNIEDQLIALSADDDVRKMWAYNGQLVYMYGRNKWYMDDTEVPTNDFTQFLFTKSELLNSPFDIDKLEPIMPDNDLIEYNQTHMENLKSF